MAKIQHSLLGNGGIGGGDEVLHRPKVHDITDPAAHSTPGVSNNTVLVKDGTGLVFKSLATFLTDSGDPGVGGEGAIWYDATNDRFLCRKATGIHVIVTSEPLP